MINICDIYFKKGKALQLFKLKLIKSGYTQEEAAKCLYACCPNELAYFYARNVVGIPEGNIFKFNGDNKNHALYLQWLSETLGDMKFDYIIQNPPYNKSLHLDFFEKGLDLLIPGKGRMVIIEPATWLINVRKNGKAKKYDAIKKCIEGHVESIKIENLNKDFGTENQVPFAITTIDMSKTFDAIKFLCCGEEREVKSIYDCNLIGDYDTVWGILGKCQKFGDMMNKHITKNEMGDDVWYAKYAEIGRCGCSSGDRIHLDSYYYGQTFKYFYFNGFDNRDPISDKPLKVKDGGNKDTDKNATCVYGTKQEMENWGHFNMHNSLPLFINYVCSIDQNNNSKEFLPWLVDKQYTDEEINELFCFTEEEIKLIDRTIKKYERNSPWFKRYMCGPDAVSYEEVNNFIKSLDE